MTPAHLIEVRDLIRTCHEQPLTLEGLSREANLSAWHFMRAFRSAFGETPHDFLTRMRIERAQHIQAVAFQIAIAANIRQHPERIDDVDGAELALVTAGAGPYGGANVLSAEHP